MKASWREINASEVVYKSDWEVAEGFSGSLAASTQSDAF